MEHFLANFSPSSRWATGPAHYILQHPTIPTHRKPVLPAANLTNHAYSLTNGRVYWRERETIFFWVLLLLRISSIRHASCDIASSTVILKIMYHLAIPPLCMNEPRQILFRDATSPSKWYANKSELLQMSYSCVCVFECTATASCFFPSLREDKIIPPRPFWRGAEENYHT